MTEDFELELRARVDTLKGEVLGLCTAVAALAAHVDIPSNGDANAILNAAMLKAKACDGEAAAWSVRTIMREYSAATAQGGDPVFVLLGSALQVTEAGPRLLPALESWLAQAGSDELAEDMRALLRKYGFRVADDDSSATPG